MCCTCMYVCARYFMYKGVGVMLRIWLIIGWKLLLALAKEHMHSHSLTHTHIQDLYCGTPLYKDAPELRNKAFCLSEMPHFLCIIIPEVRTHQKFFACPKCLICVYNHP